MKQLRLILSFAMIFALTTIAVIAPASAATPPVSPPPVAAKVVPIKDPNNGHYYVNQDGQKVYLPPSVETAFKANLKASENLPVTREVIEEKATAANTATARVAELEAKVTATEKERDDARSTCAGQKQKIEEKVTAADKEKTRLNGELQQANVSIPILVDRLTASTELIKKLTAALPSPSSTPTPPPATVEPGQ